jgi:hypothetical protein
VAATGRLLRRGHERGIGAAERGGVGSGTARLERRAAAALLGCSQYLFGGLAAPLVGIRASNGALPTAIVIAALGTAAVATLATLVRRPAMPALDNQPS